MSQGIHIVRVAPYGKESTAIQWSIDQELHDAGDLFFKVELAGSPEGPWETVGENIKNKLAFEDTNSKTFGRLKDKYYRVSAKDGAFISRPHPVCGSLPKQKYLIARKMFNDEMTMLRKGNGVRLAVVKKRHWGELCSCVDPRTKLALLPNCPDCHGTKYLKGYYDPMYTWGKINPSSMGTDSAPQTSTAEIEATQAVLLSFPIVFKDDIVVELDTNKRWLVVSSKPTEILRTAIHQEIVLSLLPVSDSVYDLEVPWDYHMTMS